MILADMTAGDWIGAVGGGITLIGGAAVGLYALFRKTKTTADDAEGKAKREALKEERGIDSEALNSIIQDLRKDNATLREQMGTIQNSTLLKIIEAHDEHHDCEKKYATLEAQYKFMEEAYKKSEDRGNALEARVKSLEGRSA